MTEFEKIYRTYFDDVYLYIRRLSGSEAIAEEIASEAFFKAARIKRILHAVPEPYKEVFMWRVYAELSFREIGQIFGKSENWSCVTYHRAKKMIQSRLEDRTYAK